MTEDLQRTPLYEEHKRLGARLVPFAGFHMPVQYPSGILAEHEAVRRSAGLFDVSHMGEFEFSGPEAMDMVQYLTTNNVARLEVGQAQYSLLCQEDGGTIDDCLVFRFPEHFLIVVNASNRQKDAEWIRQFAPRFDAEFYDASDETALLALQGPAAERILARVTDADLGNLPYYWFCNAEVAGASAMVSRTGYTGEDGFECYLPAGMAVDVWRELLNVGKGDGLIPAGLGARDSLRLEMGYPLYGNDVDEGRSPLEAGLGWTVKLKKGEFVGRDALMRQKEEPPQRKLAAFVLQDKGFPRPGYEIRAGGRPAGEVTSGVFSPSLKQGIGMGYVNAEAAQPDTDLEIMIRGRPVPARTVKPPFYKDGSLKR